MKTLSGIAVKYIDKPERPRYRNAWKTLAGNYRLELKQLVRLCLKYNKEINRLKTVISEYEAKS